MEILLYYWDAYAAHLDEIRELKLHLSSVRLLLRQTCFITFQSAFFPFWGACSFNSTEFCLQLSWVHNNLVQNHKVEKNRNSSGFLPRTVLALLNLGEGMQSTSCADVEDRNTQRGFKFTCTWVWTPWQLRAHTETHETVYWLTCT